MERYTCEKSTEDWFYTGLYRAVATSTALTDKLLAVDLPARVLASHLCLTVERRSVSGGQRPSVCELRREEIPGYLTEA